MFDRTTINQGPAYPQVIHEHRAPTDKSVELLKEFERESAKKMLDSFQCKLNELNGTIVRFRENFGETFIIKINLNGKEYTFKTQINDIDIRFAKGSHTEHEIGIIIREEFAKFLSSALLSNCNFNDLRIR